MIAVDIKLDGAKLAMRCGKHGGNRKSQTFRACLHCEKVFGPLDHLDMKFCSHKCKSESQLGKPPWNLGKKCPQLRRAQTKKCITCKAEFRSIKDFGERKQMYCSHRCYLANRRVSDFERRVMEFLGKYGMPIRRTPKIGHWTFDGQIEGTPLLLEADGTFWHSSDVAKERDSRKEAWAQANGFEIIRIHEKPFGKDKIMACSVAVARWEAYTGAKATKA